MSKGKFYLLCLKVVKRGFVLLSIITFIFLVQSYELKAFSVSGYKVEQVDATHDSVTISLPYANTTYNISVWYVSDCDEEEVFKCTTTDQVYTIKGLKPGVRYYLYVKWDTPNGNVEVNTEHQRIITIPDKLPGINYQWDIFKEVLSIPWISSHCDDIYNVIDDFEYQFYNYKGKRIEEGILDHPYTGSVKTKFIGINSDQIYCVKFRGSYHLNDKLMYTDWVEKLCIPQAKIGKISESGDKVTITWKKVKGATGYNIYTTNEPDNFIRIASVNKNVSKWTIKKSKVKKYIYVETKKKVGKKTYTSVNKYYFDSMNLKRGKFKDEY